jgi:hypothetical protein
MSDTKVHVRSMVACNSTTVKLPTGHLTLVRPGDVIGPDLMWHMTEDQLATLRDPDEIVGSEIDVDATPVESVGYVAGTDEDPRLGDAPSMNATVDTILSWVGDNPDRAEACWDREKRKTKPRRSLVSQLEQVMDT